MDDKELQEYRQKIKGLSLKELHDILTHINQQKLPEKYQAIQSEISARTGAPVPAAEPAPAVFSPAAKQKPATPQTKDLPQPLPAGAPSAAASSAQPFDWNKVLTAATVIFIIAGLYFLAIPFVNLPGSCAIRSMLLQ